MAATWIRGPSYAEPVTTPRRAGQQDVPALIALARAAYSPYVPRIGREPAPMAADYSAAVADAQVWVVDGAARLEGLLVLVPNADHLLVENLAVRPQAQGRGIGGMLLEHAHQQARALGLAQVRLYTHELMSENLAFYGRRGYVQTHRQEQDGFARVFLTRTL
jgi:GNAT superfamily N-acetyltransferase